MRIAVNLGPTANWTSVLAAAKKADDYGFDSVGFLDHYHAEKPAWGYLSGWSLYGALALATKRIKLTPMVICRLNYLPGVLAKETATLALLTEGRFSLGIGAGDYFQEMHAWGIPVPDATARIEALKETIQLLQMIWKGENVTFQGKHIQVQNALCSPPPPHPPHIIIGVGNSRKLLHSALTYAEEINVYADEALIREARQKIDSSGRQIALSTYIWEWQDDIEEKLKAWEQLGVTRAFVTFWEPFDKLEPAAHWLK